jgi:hypothetical protein
MQESEAPSETAMVANNALKLPAAARTASGIRCVESAAAASYGERYATRMRSFLISFLVLGQGCTLMPNPREIHYVGYLERNCSKIRNDEQIPSIPIGLTVTPLQAASVLPNGCTTKFFVEVYADQENYYFYNNNLDIFSISRRTADVVKKRSYVIDGHSGELLRRPEQEWGAFPPLAK